MVLIKTIDNETKKETFELQVERQGMKIAYRINKEQSEVIRKNTIKVYGNTVNTGDDTLMIDFLEPIKLNSSKDKLLNVILNAYGWFNMDTGEMEGEF